MPCLEFRRVLDRKSTRLNSSHTLISYAVFCLKKKSVGSEEHTSELQSHSHLVCRLLLAHTNAPAGRATGTPPVGSLPWGQRACATPSPRAPPPSRPPCSALPRVTPPSSSLFF